VISIRWGWLENGGSWLRTWRSIVVIAGQKLGTIGPHPLYREEIDDEE